MSDVVVGVGVTGRGGGDINVVVGMLESLFTSAG